MIITPKNKGGRPRKLRADSETLKTVEALGRIQATTIECAHFLRVDEVTWIKFKKDFPQVQAAYDTGAAEGKISLRRKQIEEALAGNSTMLVWLGKNLLGQRDQQTLEHTGANGGPIEIKSESPRDILAARLDAIAARVGTGQASGNADGQPGGSTSG